MYDFISLNVKCPVCGKSLMDKENLVDGKQSIKLNIEVKNKKGIIRLSSIYGSYNYKCDIELPTNEIIKFFCPNCSSEIKSDMECDYCQAPMIPLVLDIGGKVGFCSRVGCKGHFLKFEDISLALKKISQEQENEFKPKPYTEHIEIKEDEEIKEIVRTGAFLQAFCPNCKKSLIENNKLKVKVVKDNGETGILLLSPYLNVFTSKSSIFLSENKTVKDLVCPHCNKSLMVKDKKCEVCGSPVAKIAIAARTKLIDFYICSRKGCRWHGLSEEDIHDIELEDSIEW